MKKAPLAKTGFLKKLLILLLVAAILPVCCLFSWNVAQPAEKEVEPIAVKPAYTAVSKGRVDVEGGLVNLAAKRDGIVEKVLVKEGDLVKAGQSLAVLDDDLQQMALQVAEKELAEIVASQQVIRRQMEIAREEEKRFKQVYEKGGVAELNYLHYKNRLDVLKANLRAVQAQAETSKSRIRQAAHELERSTIVAPTDGMIVRRKVRPGDGVSTLNVTPLFVFAPHLPLIVRAELDERFMHKVRTGDQANVFAEADESHVFKALVLRVGKVFGQQVLAADDPSQRQDVRVLEVELGFTQKPDLLIGQRVRVHYLPAAAKTASR